MHSGIMLRCRRLFILASYKRSRRVGHRVGVNMSGEYPELDEMQTAYKNAVEAWIAAIRREEALASVNHSVADIDQWEQAHFDEEELRSMVKEAKAKYEDSLREKFFGF